jgi:uncharacterized membrane protein HdeD (DUF308 family)
MVENWWMIALRGVAAIVFGILTLAWPSLTLVALVLLFGAWALVDGVLSVLAALRRRRDDAPWWALLLVGLAGVAAGIVAFVYPGLTALALMYVIGAWALVIGAFGLVAAIRLRRLLPGEWRLGLASVLAIVFGVLVLVAPGAGALALVLWIGAFAILHGVILVALALRLRRARIEEWPAPMARAA